MSLSDIKVYTATIVSFLFNFPRRDLDWSQFLDNIHNVLAIILVAATIVYTVLRIRSEVAKHRFYTKQKKIQQFKENKEHAQK